MPPERRAEKAHLDEIAPVAGVERLAIVPVRIRFGIESFGVNAYSASAGGRVIEEHDELSAGAGRHEELYFVAEGHARFTLDGEEIDAPAGTFVFVSDPKVRRGAVAVGERTTVLVVGGVPGRLFQASPWEAWLEAAPFLDAGERARFALGSSDVILVETPYDGWPHDLPHVCAGLRREGLRPVLAHPERNREVIARPELIEAAVHAGALVQLTAAKVLA